MQSQKYKIPYGKSFLEFTLPLTMRVTMAVTQAAEPLSNLSGAIKDALDQPIGMPVLREIAKPGDRVCIVFTDITRSSPDHLLVPALIKELEQAGVKSNDITLLCGTGMHRPSTDEEKIAKLGSKIAANYRIIDNDPQDISSLVDLGFTSGGVPLVLNRAAVETDLLIATGIVEPHQYAGYSGGRKTAAIGAAGEVLIAHTHGPSFVDHPGTRLGQIEGNPFHEAITEAARRAGLLFILNVVLDDNKQVLKVIAGDPDLAFHDLVAFAKSVYEVPIQQQFDIAIGGVGFPKDLNLYQASRAASFLFFAPTPVVRPGGFLIIPARCDEGAGIGVGEQRFLSAMRDAPTVQFILEDARHHGYLPGQQRAFVMAKVLEETKVVIVGCKFPNLVEDCKMIPARTVEEAIEIASASLGSTCDVLIVPQAMHTLPVIQTKFSETSK